MLSRGMVELIKVKTITELTNVCQILFDKNIKRYAVYTSKDDNGDDLYTVKVWADNSKLNRVRRSIMKKEILS